MMQRATIAFRHSPEGIRTPILRSRLAIARQTEGILPDVTRLHRQLICGSLRQEGGAELIGHLRRIFASRPEPSVEDLIFLWLFGVKTDPSHKAKDLTRIAEQVSRGEIRVRDYMPLPQRATV